MRFAIVFLLSVAAASHAAESPAYWVWRTSDLALVPKHAVVYVYQGNYGQQATWVSRGPKPGKEFSAYKVIPLIRVYELKDPAILAREISAVVDQWVFLGIAIDEVQLDYDSPSAGLKNYARFLAELQRELKKPEYPFSFRISVTGLVTWLGDNPQDLALLSRQASYIHYQLYNEYDPLRRVNEYLPQLAKVRHPYKLGITTSPHFAALELPHNEHYLGTAVFLNRP